MMIDALNGRSMGLWLDNGGQATIDSYAGYQTARTEDRDWLDTLPLMIETENHVFVHAGCNPRYALAEQPDEVLLWIRKWEDDEHDFGKHVVYGHTVRPEPKLCRFSTGLDTGACFDGPLTVGVFDPDMNAGPVEILKVF
jgi:serine/threonine protein phosphatase 1